MGINKKLFTPARIGAVLALTACGFIYFNNAAWRAEVRGGKSAVLAHRGIAQRYDTTDLRNDTCTAARMLPPVHAYLENTIESMRASFAAGADIVELDIHPTVDGHFAVFHDWTLDCRTEGTGVTRAHTLAQLQQLDIGYGYTADGGRSYPFRGTAIGRMPSLDEVLETFPERSFLINIKSNDAAEGVLLAQRLGQLAETQQQRLMVYGGDQPIAALHARLPQLRMVSRASLKRCLLSYAALSWSGTVPAACEHTLVLVPVNIGPWLWGWPNHFVARMERAGSRVFVLGPYRGADFSSGIDTAADLARLPPGFAGGFWTNEIEWLGRVLDKVD
jgi:glycerophosphoryl diester phosphodiesterase